MRNRMIKKEFWTDDKILELEPVGKLLFIGIWNFSDDEGILRNSSKVLKAQIFPADDTTVNDIDIMIKNMVNIGLLLINKDNTLLKVKNWTDHQKINRPTPSKYDFVRGEIIPFTEESVRPHGVLTTNRIERNRIERNRIHQSKKKDELFEVWYFKYPRKVGKQAAIKAFSKLDKKHKQICIDVIDGHVRHWIQLETGMEHIPHPSTWLNEGRYDDQLQAVDLKEQLRADRLEREEANRKAKDKDIVPATQEEKEAVLKEIRTKVFNR